MIEKLRDIFANKKTYLVAISGILVAITAYANGEIQLEKLIGYVVEGILAITIRAGISKVGT